MSALTPDPRSRVPGDGEFVLHAGTGVHAPPPLAGLFRELLGPATGFGFPPGCDVVLPVADEPAPGPEGYRLHVTAAGTEATGTEAGPPGASRPFGPNAPPAGPQLGRRPAPAWA